MREWLVRVSGSPPSRPTMDLAARMDRRVTLRDGMVERHTREGDPKKGFTRALQRSISDVLCQQQKSKYPATVRMLSRRGRRLRLFQRPSVSFNR